MEWWQMLPIGLLMLAIDLLIFMILWFMLEGSVVESGFRRRKARSVKKLKKSYTIPARLLLVLIFDAKQKSVYLILCFVFQLINILTFGACIVSFFACMITLADGWCLTMLLGAQLADLLITAGLMFIPDLIWNPKERRRYNIFK